MQRWDDKDPAGTLFLLTPKEFQALPDGTEVVGIFGEKKVKGEDYIDDDTRGGHMAYGIYCKEPEE